MQNSIPYSDRYDRQTQSVMLANNQLTDESLFALSQRNWEKMVSLHLAKNNFTDKAYIKFFKDKKFIYLKSLWLCKNSLNIDSSQNLSDEGMKALSSCQMPNVETLWLSFNKITHQGIQYLVQKQYPKLRKLMLSVNPIGPKGIQSLALCNWNNLLKLQLYDCKLGDQGMKFLIQNQWPKVQQLHLSNNQIGDRGISFLVQCKWPQCQFVHLSTNPFGQQGAIDLIEHKWPKLNKLKMKRTKKLSQQIKKKLRTRFFPKIAVTFD